MKEVEIGIKRAGGLRLIKFRDSQDEVELKIWMCRLSHKLDQLRVGCFTEYSADDPSVLVDIIIVLRLL